MTAAERPRGVPSGHAGSAGRLGHEGLRGHSEATFR
ncbi:hypothetical protein BJ964_005887 [Actinoplanes lobatus]|uniref:Uncharacterized protein n=1 Tax=Actinoplanes lobatus TaxID=113568 RepID=A0A7W7MIU0_9ACTN|nr:hypothetical protein [Actinoplanes lobatus]